MGDDKALVPHKKRGRAVRQIRWWEIPETAARVDKVWVLWCKRQSLRTIAEQVGVSHVQVREDVRRMQVKLADERLEVAGVELASALAVHMAIIREAWETLEYLKSKRGEIVSHSTTDKGGEATGYLPAAASGKSEADLIRTIRDSEKAMEELQGLRSKTTEDGESYQDNRVQVVVGPGGEMRMLVQQKDR
jgi:hypothetical protein